MFCPYCGKDIAQNATFCPKCGKQIKRAAAANQTAVMNAVNPAKRFAGAAAVAKPSGSALAPMVLTLVVALAMVIIAFAMPFLEVSYGFKNASSGLSSAASFIGSLTGSKSSLGAWNSSYTFAGILPFAGVLSSYANLVGGNYAAMSLLVNIFCVIGTIGFIAGIVLAVIGAVSGIQGKAKNRVIVLGPTFVIISVIIEMVILGFAGSLNVSGYKLGYLGSGAIALLVLAIAMVVIALVGKKMAKRQ